MTARGRVLAHSRWYTLWWRWYRRTSRSVRYSAASTWHGRGVPYTRDFDQPAPTDHPDAVIPGEHRVVEKGAFRVHLQEVFPLERLAQAHHVLVRGDVRGKLVITV